MNRVTRFWAETRTFIPSTLKINRAGYSPGPGSRGAIAPQDKRTGANAATGNRIASSRARAANPSGPEMDEGGLAKRQNHRPKAAPEGAREGNGTTPGRKNG